MQQQQQQQRCIIMVAKVSLAKQPQWWFDSIVCYAVVTCEIKQ